MLLYSTHHRSPAVTFRQALGQGLAPDGGLYIPEDLPRVTLADLDAWRQLAWPDVAVQLAQRCLRDEFEPEVIERLTREAFSFPVPTVPLEDRLCVLELFHGPTLAFKDVGARFLARVFSHVLAEQHEHATILVATSGDTGSAVASGFHGVDRVRVVLLYPRGRISRFQEAQMATLGDNVRALSVPGAFDDCQRLVKTAFLDPGLRRLHLSSANSINIGRLLPQSFYYVASYLAATATAGEPVVFSVPSGNLGNLTAGVLAQRMGVPVTRFVAATNANDVLPEYLRTGTYRPRPAVRTRSNAMDVGDPSNFARLADLHGGSVAAMREGIVGMAVDEAETIETIRLLHRRTGYVIDPHGAVGYAAALRYAASDAGSEPLVVLATAHPAKFADTITEALGLAPPLPPGYQDWTTRPWLGANLPDTEYRTFRDWLEREIAD